MIMTPTSRNECEYQIMKNKLSIVSATVTVLAHSRSQQVVILSLPTHSYRHTPPSCLRHCNYGKRKNFLTRLSNRLTWRSHVHLENRRPLIWLFIEILLIFWGLCWWINYSQMPVLKMMPVHDKMFYGSLWKDRDKDNKVSFHKSILVNCILFWDYGLLLFQFLNVLGFI